MDDAKEKMRDDIQHLKSVDELRKVEAFIQELKAEEHSRDNSQQESTNSSKDIL